MVQFTYLGGKSVGIWGILVFWVFLDIFRYLLLTIFQKFRQFRIFLGILNIFILNFKIVNIYKNINIYSSIMYCTFEIRILLFNDIFEIRILLFNDIFYLKKFTCEIKWKQIGK